MRDENGKAMRGAQHQRNLRPLGRGTAARVVFYTPAPPRAAKAADPTDAARVIWGRSGGRARLKGDGGRQFEDRWRWLNAQRRGDGEPERLGGAAGPIDEHFARIEDADAAMSVADVGFSVYDDMRAVLSEMGIPSTEIAFIHDFETPAQKQKLFSRVNAGAIRADGLIAEDGRTNAQAGSSPCTTWTRRQNAPRRRAARGQDHPPASLADPDGFDGRINAYSTEGTSDTIRVAGVAAQAQLASSSSARGGIDAMDEDGGDSDQYAEFAASRHRKSSSPAYNLEAERRDRCGIVVWWAADRQGKRHPLRRTVPSAQAGAELIGRGGRRRDPGDLSYGGESGSIDGPSSHMSAARRAYERRRSRSMRRIYGWQADRRRDGAKLAAEDAAGCRRRSGPRFRPRRRNRPGRA